MPGHPRLGVRIVVDAACFARVDPARDAAFDRGSGRGSRPGVPAGVRDRLAARGDRSARPRAPGSRAPSRRRSIFDFPLAFFPGNRRPIARVARRSQPLVRHLCRANIPLPPKSRRRTNLSTVARARRSHPRAQRSPRPSLPDPSSAAPPRTPRAAHVRRRPRRSLRFFAHSFRGRTRQPPSQCRSRPSGSTTSARARPWSTRASSPSSAPSSRRSKTPAWCALASLAPSRGSRDEPTATRRETRGGSRPAPRS